jgi:hypothetical protein
LSGLKRKIFNELTRAGRMISQMPLDNITVHYKQVPISDADYLWAGHKSPNLRRGSGESRHERRRGCWNYVVRGFLESKKVPAVLKMVHESIKKGNQAIVFASESKKAHREVTKRGLRNARQAPRGTEQVRQSTIGQVYGGDNKRSANDIDRFQRNAVKIMIATPIAREPSIWTIFTGYATRPDYCYFASERD